MPESEVQAQDVYSPTRSWVAALLAWLLPGAGHLYLGARLRAILFMALVGSAVILGCALDGNLYRVVPDQPLTQVATVASMGTGAVYFFLRLVLGYTGDVVSAGYEYGTAFLLTAGLMNLLLVLDAWDLGSGRKP